MSLKNIRKYPDAYLGNFIELWLDEKHDKDEIPFIDRDGTRFRLVADFYRNGRVHMPATESFSAVQDEFDFFNLPVTRADIQADSVAEYLWASI